VELYLNFALYPCGVMISKPRDTYVFTKIVISLEAHYRPQYHGTQFYSNPPKFSPTWKRNFCIKFDFIVK